MVIFLPRGNVLSILNPRFIGSSMSFLKPIASIEGHPSKAIVQPRATDGFHSLLPFRFLQGNELTELPPGVFDSLSSLLLLYVPSFFLLVWKEFILRLVSDG